MSTPKLVPIRMPNPYFEKDNNAYLVDIGELILIDTGVDTPEAFSTLKKTLSAKNYDIKNISKIFLTHKHLDHFGLAHRIVKHSGADVFIHQDDHLDVTQFEERDSLVSNLYLERMQSWGVPDNFVDMIGMRTLITELGRSISAQSFHEDERIPIGSSELRVIHTPGHTQGSCCFVLNEWLFTGDHLLPTYTPNIGATEVTSSHMLAKYRNSLQKIRGLRFSRIFPGHGNEMSDLDTRIDEILNHHTDREERLCSLLSSATPHSVYDLAVKLFGELKEHHVLLGAGEVHAHLELLETEGRVSSNNNLYSLT